MELISLDNWLLWRQSHSYFIILNLHQEEDEVIWKRSKNEPEKNPSDEEEETQVGSKDKNQVDVCCNLGENGQTKKKKENDRKSIKSGGEYKNSRGRVFGRYSFKLNFDEMQIFVENERLQH